MSHAIILRGLRFAWPFDDAFSLSISTFEVEDSTAAAILGPSGAGKSTLLALLGGELLADRGMIEVWGVDPSRRTPAQRRADRLARFGLLFADAPLIDHLSAAENILLPLRLHPTRRLDREGRAHAESLARTLDLAGCLRRRPVHLSSGERRRVALARALVTKPPLLLLDEPTAGLDPARRDATLALLDLARASWGATVVLSTHDPVVAARCASCLTLGAP